jgi:adenylate cyclase
MERRLSAIIAADAVNFSGRMREDEAAALTAVKSCVEEIFEPVIASHNGRIVKLIGDGLLAEFASAVEAVSCAAEVQENLDARNAGLTADTCFRYRIGVNLGDIIVDGGDIFGDGVNIASRLESIAEPGGVAISASVYDQVRAKVDLSFEDLGEKELKNIPDPIRVYRLTSKIRSGSIV